MFKPRSVATQSKSNTSIKRSKISEDEVKPSQNICDDITSISNVCKNSETVAVVSCHAMSIETSIGQPSENEGGKDDINQLSVTEEATFVGNAFGRAKRNSDGLAIILRSNSQLFTQEGTNT
jgi:hypothetical protein